ncbi:hypothetical protein PPM_2627 [Paenibacillus polymyxa M1]|uniref:hypothetical protein n=1 Tax=Paenibacillus polymyxa TaxID=1406 RepID=UPI00021BBD35|nr:hypothetical protein [Paenibacillus polymyxa]CCC85564.1 hypothetical protein PPM_2627 [Paenibacillus polymyxa M1]
MAIQQPRRFVTTDQGHADVLNKPIDTLYENDQELSAQIADVKTYVDGAIKEAKVPDASTTQKGIVRMSADYKSTSPVTVPNSKALSDLYGLSFVDRGKPFSVDWNFIVLPGAHRIDVATLNPVSDHSPPGANTKGVLFVSSVIVGQDSVFVQRYVDETGGIFNRIRTAAGTWTDWRTNGGGNMVLVASNNVRLSQATTYAQQVASGGGSSNLSPTMLVFKFIPKALGELRIYWEGLVELVSGTAPTDANSNWGISASAHGSNTWSAGDDSEWVEYAVQKTLFNYRDGLGTTRDSHGSNSPGNTISSALKPGLNSWFGSEGVMRVTSLGPVYIAFYIYAANYGSGGAGAYTIKGSIRNIQVCYDEVTP